MNDDINKIKEMIKEKSKDGKLACRVAFEIANELDVSPRRVGDVATAMEIKIAGCQLGCFK